MSEKHKKLCRGLNYFEHFFCFYFCSQRLRFNFCTQFISRSSCRYQELYSRIQSQCSNCKKRSSTQYVRKKIAKITPPPSLYSIVRIWLDPPLCVGTFYIFTPLLLPTLLLINFYSDSSFRHSQFLGCCHFHLFLRLNFTLKLKFTLFYTQ